MPIVIPRALPAYDILTRENIFVMAKKRAVQQDIRPIEIVIVNLMPTKIETETQLMRLLGNSPLQVNVTLLNMSSHTAKNVSKEHLERFYKTFDEIKDRRFDGMIITGAPVETLSFKQVTYWEELKKIMDFAKKNVTTSVFICWGAQAALHYFYGIEKVDLPKKMFGIFDNRHTQAYDHLLKGVDDVFKIPMSRHTSVNEEQLRAHPDLVVLAAMAEGASVIKSRDDRFFFLMGHSEYDRDTLKKEYLRDLEKGLSIDPPENYFVGGDMDRIDVSWRSTANLIFANWLNYYVYQITPFDWSEKE